MNDVVWVSTQVSYSSTANKHTKYCNQLLCIRIKDFEINALHTCPIFIFCRGGFSTMLKLP